MRLRHSSRNRRGEVLANRTFIEVRLERKCLILQA
jgi:hypothetical protein